MRMTKAGILFLSLAVTSAALVAQQIPPQRSPLPKPSSPRWPAPKEPEPEKPTPRKTSPEADPQKPEPAKTAAAAKPLTSRQIIERIKTQVGVPWTEPTVDTFKAGDPDSTVTGIAVTMMATLDVLQRAAASGKNLIITHEPTFYGHQDDTAELEKENDPVLAAKQAFIKEHRLVIFRFHDYWHRRHPDGVLVGMTKALGWEEFKKAGSDRIFELPGTMTLEALAADIRKGLDIKALRVVGDPAMKVKTIGLSPGFSGFPAHRKIFPRDVDVLVLGEAHEWETIEYVADAISAKMPKAAIVLGHIPSEQAGMEECAGWLKTFVTEVPIAFVPAAEPFWVSNK